MTYDIDLTKRGKPIDSVAAIHGLPYGCEFLPFVREKKYMFADNDFDAKKVKEMAKSFHDDFTNYCLELAKKKREQDTIRWKEKFTDEQIKELFNYPPQIGSDPCGMYFHGVYPPENEFRATLRLLTLYQTAAAQNCGLSFH